MHFFNRGGKSYDLREPGKIPTDEHCLHLRDLKKEKGKDKENKGKKDSVQENLLEPKQNPVFDNLQLHGSATSYNPCY